MNWQKTQSPWLKILAVFGADEPMSSVSAQKQSPWVETVSPRAHEFRHNPKKGPQKTPKFMGSLPHDRAHITCWLGSGCLIGPTIQQSPNQTAKISPGPPWLDYDIIPCGQGTTWYIWFFIFLVPNILACSPCPWGKHFWDRQGTAPLHPTWSSCHDLKHFGRCRCCTLETTNTRQTEYNENTMTLYHFSVNRSLTFRPFIV